MGILNEKNGKMKKGKIFVIKEEKQLYNMLHSH
jgi:hypothetical protein